MNRHRLQAPNVAHFGLGDRNRRDCLVIRWPSGKEQVLTNVAADRHLVVEEE